MPHHDPLPVGILGLGAYVPERVMTNDEWAEHVDTSDAWIRARTGIEQRRIAAEDESTADLALAAARAALDDAGIEASELDEIVIATDTPEVYIPDTASFVQHRLGARNIPAYDLGGSGCAGFVLALDVASARVRAGRRKVLVIGVELLTRLMDWQDRNTCVLFGDAAGAVVLGEVERGGLLAAVAGTDGSRADILCVEVGGTRKPFNAERAEKRLHQKVAMNGRMVFKEAVARMSESARQALAQAGRSIDDVDLVIPHQANLRIIQAVGKALGVGRDRVFVNVQHFGNTGSASVPLALAQAREQGRVRSGDLLLMTSFGAGFHWASVLLEM